MWHSDHSTLRSREVRVACSPASEPWYWLRSKYSTLMTNAAHGVAQQTAKACVSKPSGSSAGEKPATWIAFAQIAPIAMMTIRS